MSSKLCPHVTLAHFDAERDERIIRAWQPVAVKLMWPNGPHPYLRLFRDVPLLIMREWALSEEKDFNTTASAVARGHVHAERCRLMWQHIKGEGFSDPNQFAWEGLNEPWEVPAPLLDDYYAAFLARLREYGLRGVALNYGVGWPADHGAPDTPVNWEPYGKVYAELKRGDHFLGLHEYWSHMGVKAMHDDGRGGQMGGWRWEAGRWLQCPWDVPILITETGIDEGVVPGQPNHGWRAFYENSPQTYVAQLAEYDAELRKDPRIVAATIFTHDTNDRKWQSFDTRHDGFLSVFLPYIESQRNAPTPPPPADATPDWLKDVVDTLPRHPTLRYPKRPGPVDSIVIHHTATAPDTSVEAIARYHTQADPARNKGEWAGIGYSIVIAADGTTYLTQRLDTMGNHIHAHNGHTIGLSFIGDFTKAPPTAAQMDSGRRALAWLLDQLKLKPESVKGHKDFTLQTTDCPGNLPREQWWRALLTTFDEQDMRNQAWNIAGIPLNTASAFYKEAARLNLGYPITPEFDRDGYRMQGFQNGILVCRIGDWGNMTLIPWL